MGMFRLQYLGNMIRQIIFLKIVINILHDKMDVSRIHLQMTQQAETEYSRIHYLNCPQKCATFCFHPPKDSNKREQILTCCRKGPPNESFHLVYSTRPTIGPLVSVSVLGVTETHNRSWSPSLCRLWIYPNKSVFYLNGTWFCAISMGNYRYQTLRDSDILYTTCIWYINIHTSYTYIHTYIYIYICIHVFIYIYTMYIPCIFYN